MTRPIILTYVLPLREVEIEIQEFLDDSGRSEFARWFDGLNAVAAARVNANGTEAQQEPASHVGPERQPEHGQLLRNSPGTAKERRR